MDSAEAIARVEPQEHHCCLPRAIRTPWGFMGLTHALSAVATFLVLLVFIPGTVTGTLGGASVAFIYLCGMLVVGSAMLNDLDNTNSSAESALGPMGDVLSGLFRVTSSVIQTTIRTGKDDAEPNPHRGFYHTIPAAVLVGLLVWLLSLTSFFTVDIPLVGEATSGDIFATLVAWGVVHIAISVLLKDSLKSLKKSAVGELVVAALSFLVTLPLMNTADVHDYRWLGISITTGMIVHILGDLWTTAGVPITFPIPHRGKLWWNWRLSTIKAGGVVEKWIFVPVLSVASVICLVILTLFR